MASFKLAPSDLTFLYNECSRCFYNKVRGIAKRPFQPFPSIFKTIDKCMRDCYHGIDPQQISLSLPHGRLSTETKRLASAPIPVGDHTVTFGGEMDALARYVDRTVGVQDFKTSVVKDAYTQMYARQLHVYRDILRYPKFGHTETVSTLGLLCATPESMEHTGGCGVMKLKLEYVPIAIDDDWWESFLTGVVELLAGDEPDSGDCFWCKVQRLSV